MTHPQFDEVLGRVEAILALPSARRQRRGSILSVIEPETGSSVEIVVGRRGRLEVRFTWPEDAASWWDVSRRLVLPAPAVSVRTAINPFTGEAIEIRHSSGSRRVEDAREAAGLSLAIVRDLYGIAEDRWLWITDMGDTPDQWPDPLPKPSVWPPGR